MKKDNRIYVAGHTGMVGSAIIRKLKEEGIRILFAGLWMNLTLRTSNP